MLHRARIALPPSALHYIHLFTVSSGSRVSIISQATVRFAVWYVVAVARVGPNGRRARPRRSYVLPRANDHFTRGHCLII